MLIREIPCVADSDARRIWTPCNIVSLMPGVSSENINVRATVYMYSISVVGKSVDSNSNSHVSSIGRAPGCLGALPGVYYCRMLNRIKQRSSCGQC